MGVCVGGGVANRRKQATNAPLNRHGARRRQRSGKAELAIERQPAEKKREQFYVCQVDGGFALHIYIDD